MGNLESGAIIIGLNEHRNSLNVCIVFRLLESSEADPQCLNENCGRTFSLETCAKAGRSGGTRITEKHITKNSEAQRLKALKAKQSPKWKKRIAEINRKNVESGHLARIGNQRWISTVDGYISNAAGVSYHNRRNGWDPALKRKL